MKYLFLIATISCLLTKDIYQFSWDIWYQLHKKEVAEKLCENKEKPLLKCNGKCFLAKQLKKAEVQTKKEQNKAPVRPRVLNDLKFIEQVSSTLFLCIPPSDLKSKSRYHFKEKYWNFEMYSQIEHPPCT